MQIQRIQNNNYNTNFNARLQLTGVIEDIGKETRQLWEKKAQSIGNDKDLITLHFGTFMTERGDIYKNKQFYPWMASIRAIYASVIMNGKNIHENKYIGYRVMNRPHTNELRNQKVSEFLDALGCKKEI